MQTHRIISIQYSVCKGLSNQKTPLSGDIKNQTVGPEVVKKFPAFHKTRRSAMYLQDPATGP